MSEILGRYIEVDGCRTYYEEAGSGDALLFLAPAGRETSQWQHCLPHFGKRYRSIAVDLPGHGKSAHWPDGKYIDSMEGLSKFVRTFWRSLRIKRIAVIGCSLGANLSYALAARYPDEVAAIVPLQGAAYTPVINFSGLEFLVHPHVNLIHHLADNVSTLTGTASTAAGRAYLEDTVASVNPEALKADLTAYGKCDLRIEMSQIRCPVLAVRGTQDWFVPDEFIDDTLGLLNPGVSASKVRISGIGHFPHVENPGLLFEHIDPFLATNYAPTH
jgi:pimeloyl-ACP methyl ester carboxylesterase